jgi:hypothetical protein
MRKLFGLAVLLGLTALMPAPRVEAIGYPSCDLPCPTTTTNCSCPPWTDRPGHITTCGSWNRVGGCWYE